LGLVHRDPLPAIRRHRRVVDGIQSEREHASRHLRGCPGLRRRARASSTRNRRGSPALSSPSPSIVEARLNVAISASEACPLIAWVGAYYFSRTFSLPKAKTVFKISCKELFAPDLTVAWHGGQRSLTSWFAETAPWRGSV